MPERHRNKGVPAIRRRALLLVAVMLLGTGAPSIRAQGARGLPRMPFPEAPQPETERSRQPVFRAAVTRVEVSALVLDDKGNPVRGLTAADFQVLENGAPQTIRSFTPFTYEPDLLVLPDPVLAPTDAQPRPASPIASNFYAGASRVFALILDDLHIDVRRTQAARAAARRLVEQLGPTDLLFVTRTSTSESTGFLTRDRTAALRLIDDLMGQRLLDKTLGERRFPGHNDDVGRLDHFQRLCASIRDVSLALRDVSGRRKTLVLLSEGSSFGAGMSDMVSRQYVQGGSGKVIQDALAAAAVGNVAIYPLNPAGLDTADSDLMSGFGEVRESSLVAILTEARQAKEMMRDFAALTGGASLVDTNDALGAVDRALRDAGSHYVLTYEPAIPAKGAEHRSIEVKVRRFGLRVLARRGYRAPGTKRVPPMKAPDSLSPQLRTLLSGVMPDDGLPMRVQAVPMTRKGNLTSVAVIVEVNGSVLGAERREGAWKMEQGLLTVNASGKTANGTRRIFDVTLSPAQWDILAETGLRSVWAVELPKGRHHLRVGSVHQPTGRGGSVYLEVDVPDGPAPPSSVLVASHFLSAMPTVFADERLGGWAAPVPTATRVFPEGDVLTVTVPYAGATPLTARLATAAGRVVWEGASTAVEGASAARFVIPSEGLGTQVCELTIASGGSSVRTTIGIVSARDGKARTP